jgi:hypothetical protein
MYKKLLTLYPELTQADFDPFTGTIVLQNDSDGRGDYIKFWTNSNPEPTAEQLAAIIG